jgi:hypothetical protein
VSSAVAAASYDGKRAVGEVMLVAGVEEELRVLDLLDDLASSLDVALADEDRVVGHAVDLDGDTVGPGSERPLAADRDTRVEEQRAAGAGTCLGQLLRHHLAEREPGVHQLVGQVGGGSFAPLDHLLHPGRLDEGHTLVDRIERPPVEKVGCVHCVPGGPELIRERLEARGRSLGVVEQQDLGQRNLQLLR